MDDDEVVIERDLSNKEPVQDTEVNDKHIVGEDSQEITIEEDADDNGTKVAEEKPSDKTENEVVEEKKVSDVELIKDAENNTHPATTMKYTCKTWRKDFDKRPDVIMHIITQEKRQIHQQNAVSINNELDIRLYSKFRYSCTTCSMFFMTYEDLQNHRVSLNSRCYLRNHGVRLDPVYYCHNNIITL